MARPRQNTGSGFLDQSSDSIYKSLSIVLILEDISTFYPPYHDMMEGPGYIQTCFSRHFSLFLYLALSVKDFLNLLNNVPLPHANQAFETRVVKLIPIAQRCNHRRDHSTKRLANFHPITPHESD